MSDKPASAPAMRGGASLIVVGLAAIALILNIVDLLQSAHFTWSKAARDLMLPLGILSLGGSMLFRDKSKAAANVLLAVSFVLFIMRIWIQIVR